MDEYFLMISIIGLAAFGMAWMPAFTKRTGISYAILYVSAGVIIYSLFPGNLPSADPILHGEFTMYIAELVVIISLMGTGIKIDRAYTWKNWASPLRLAGIAMLLCITGVAAAGYSFIGLNMASAVLLGAVLAPTDPVLACGVQVGPPNVGVESESRFALTTEAGLNDGMAFPFVWLAIVLKLSNNFNSFELINWVGYYLIYKLLAGILFGYLVGKLAGFLIFKLSEKYNLLKANDGFLALSLTLLVYGLTELVHGYGFIAVFITAITLRHYDKEHKLHAELYSFIGQAERLLTAILLLLFGGALTSGILFALTWKMALFSLLFIFLIRPVAAYISLYGLRFYPKERLAISFLGIRGIGSIFYLAFALQQTAFDGRDELWAMVAFTILISIVIHGLSAAPILKHLKENVPKPKTTKNA